VFLTGDRKQLPGHVSFCVEFIEGEAMLLLLAAKGHFFGERLCCSSKALKASPYCSQWGVPARPCPGSIVFSLGMGKHFKDIDYLLRSSLRS